ncbi:MAG: hypothetical protein K2P68_09515 [Sphingomonas sp.]|nr:hypothetical protein [Sphingomonas sp.]
MPDAKGSMQKARYKRLGAKGQALVFRGRAWQGLPMASPSQKSPAAGGVLIALGAIGGSIVGLYSGQPTIGFLVGLAGGSLIAVLIWWRGHPR